MADVDTATVAPQSPMALSPSPELASPRAVSFHLPPSPTTLSFNSRTTTPSLPPLPPVSSSSSSRKPIKASSTPLLPSSSSHNTNKPQEEEDQIASFKKMLDEILDNAALSSESLSQGLDLNSNKSGLSTSSSSTHLSTASSAAAAAAASDRVRLCRSTTLGFLLPQPKNHFAKLKEAHKRSPSTVDVDLLHKLEEQNNMLPPQESTSYLLARLERQNGLLDTDPKSVCIESNVLKGNLDTLHRLIADSTTHLNSPNSQTAITDDTSITGPQPGDEDIDWEFWGMLVQDYTAVASKLPHLLSARVRQGLPSKLRGLIWQSMSQAASTHLGTLYTRLLMEHSPYERIIQRDLARTFPQVDMFKEEGGQGQTMLRNVLKAYSIYDPLVGYCQGLGFLVGPLLMNMDEKEAFCVFVRLMETYDMRTMFTLNMEGLQLRLYQFSALLSEHLPMLHAHLSFHSIHAAMYASQWFLSLFAYTYPLPLVLRIYDVVFTEGAPETIMRVAVAFLKKNEEKLMQLQEFEDLLEVLSTKLYDIYDDNAGEVIRDAMELSAEISKEKLDALAMTYLAELEDQQKRAGEATSKRFRDRFGSSKSKPEDKAVVASTTATATKAATKPKMGRAGSRLSIAASFGSTASLLLNGSSSSSSSSDDETVSEQQRPMTPSSTSPVNKRMSVYGQDAMLLEQIQDLAKALSTLQKDHVEVTEVLVTAKMEKTEHLQEIDSLRKRISDMERQQNRASMMSATSPSVMSNCDTISSATMASPRAIMNEDGKMSLSWSRDSQDYSEDTLSISSLSVSQDDLSHRLIQSERELCHVTAELVHAKVSVLEAMNEVESQKVKNQTMERVLMDSKEAVHMLQDQQMVLQQTKMAMVMELDSTKHERDQFEKELNVIRQQFEETKRLWLESQVEKHSLQEKVKELEMNAAFVAANENKNLARGRGSVRKSMNEVAMLTLMTSRSGSPSPRASAQMTPVSEMFFGGDNGMMSPQMESRRESGDSLDSHYSSSNGTRLPVRRGSSDTQHSNQSETTAASSRPTAMVRKGWPSEKAANAGVVPSAPVATMYGTRKFMVAETPEGSKLKRSNTNRNSLLGALSFRRTASESSA
ncbi:hypothetical protein BGZ83_002538 [Gryganskiella cystojenkinii]|nr:hypothetical protein BGZ83_002538 [Gryganskiella cystojenkinii]